MAETTPEILHIAPSDPRRGCLPQCAREYAEALRNGAGDALKSGAIEVISVLDHTVPEWLGDENASVAPIKAACSESLKRYASGDRQVIHAEFDRQTVREFWAALHVSRLRPDCPLCLTFHDPPHLPPPVREAPVSTRGGLFERFLSESSRAMSRYGRARIESALLARAAALFAPSRRAAALLAERFPNLADRVCCIPPFNLGPTLAEIEPNPRRSMDTLVVTYLGFIESAAGILNVLDALVLIHRQMPLGGRVQFRIRGPVSDEAASQGVVDRIQDRIRDTSTRWLVDFAPGPIGESRVSDLLRDTDILVLPYAEGECDGNSMTLMRAQTWAVAAVAADVGCMRELIDDGRDGILYPAHDIGLLAESLRSLIANPDLRMAMARTLRRRALRERIPAELPGRMEPIYRELLDARDEGRTPDLPAWGDGEAQDA